MRTVAIVAAHFVPSNLAAVHRSRLLSLHLKEFDWDPLIVTTHWRHYEEKIEPELSALHSPDLQIIRTKAMPTRPFRIVGDIGIRGFLWHYAALAKLSRNRKIDFLYITIPSFYSACLGRLIHKKFGIPYGIDYIDPWVHYPPGSEKRLTKKWAAARLAEILEPWAIKHAALISGINRKYFEGVLDRNPKLADSITTAEMPYGGSRADHDYARAHNGPASLFDPHRKKFNMIYAGAMLPRGYPILEILLEGIALLERRRPTLSEQFHLHFVGTGKTSDDAAGFNILPHIKRHGLQACATEYPQRLPYLDVLRHLDNASGVLIIGSTEPHYAPSKIFQAILAKKPLLAILHEQSAAFALLRAANCGLALAFNPNAPIPASEIANHVEAFIFNNDYSEKDVRWDLLEDYSARNSAKLLARGLDTALKRHLTRTSMHHE